MVHNARAIGLNEHCVRYDGADTCSRCEPEKLSPVSGKKRQSVFGPYGSRMHVPSQHNARLSFSPMTTGMPSLCRTSEVESCHQIDTAIRRGAWRKRESLNVIRNVKES
jgi:hypothetical protein